jgi:hypothetical protein
MNWKAKYFLNVDLFFLVMYFTEKENLYYTDWNFDCCIVTFVMMIRLRLIVCLRAA